MKTIYEKMSKYMDEHELPKTSYNVFSVLEVEDKEVIMCRMLCDLLNPLGQHQKGDLYLRSFLRKVLNVKEQNIDEYVKDACVYKEYQLVDPYRGTERRIDIVICNDTHFVPIEVKIFAGDQQSQCYIYWEYAAKYDKEAIVYYLTPDGKEPSEYSRKLEVEGNSSILSLDKIRLLSFSEDITGWLKDQIEAESDDGMKWMLTQYLQAVESFCGTVNMGVKDMVTEELLGNSKNLAAGIEIGKAIKGAQAELIRRLMDEYRRQMEPLLSKYHLEDLGADSWYTYEQQAGIFYDGYSSFPGINYKLGKASLKNGREIWLRIEIEWKLFVGFCLFDTNTVDQVDKMTEADKQEIQQYLNLNRIDNENWWIYWRYLPDGTKDVTDRIPEFKNMNKAAIELADKDKMVAMVSESVKMIESQFLSKIK